ncbi:hypothetical protein E2562_007324 [Oryza meyeriana var. granulata]|uniref:Uncharacterized protein n=1 Tax=Oryza meyeriana var. granulata TaxID=110450 RepID=A0A6G1CZM7_9ORYZ|nr:hypothetical protein E2562_007324 [Oryza meyeriana var. granulata]
MTQDKGVASPDDQDHKEMTGDAPPPDAEEDEAAVTLAAGRVTSTDADNQDLVVRGLFKQIEPPLLQMPLRPTEQLLPTPTENTDARIVRRSPRLAKKVTASVPITLRAQINLCRHLGIVPADGALTERALADYKAMFDTSLLPAAIEALTLLFGLNNPQLQGRDEALAKMLGPMSPDDTLCSLGGQGRLGYWTMTQDPSSGWKTCSEMCIRDRYWTMTQDPSSGWKTCSDHKPPCPPLQASTLFL